MRNTYSVNEAKQEIKNSISVYMKKDETGRYILPEYKKNPFYLVGAPGIGKTEMVKQIAQELDLGFFATSVTHHTRNSMLGLPVITEQDWGKYTEYTMPDILAQVEKRQLAGEKEGILLIDEFASMSEALVAPMLAFLQSKSVGNHTLPEGWVIILCSNPPEFNETAREFDAAVMDRVRLMNIEYSKEDFLKYARTHKMHPIILDYLKQQDEGGYICRRTGGKSEIVTARGWENLSDCLYGYEKLEKDISEKLIYQFIKSEKTATEFYRFYLTNKTVFSVKEVEGILKGEGMEKSLGKIRKYSYMKKLQSLNYILDTVSGKCQSRMENYDLLKEIKNRMGLMESDLLHVEGDVFTNEETGEETLFYNDDALEFENVLMSWKNGEESSYTEEREVPEKERKLLERVCARIDEKKMRTGMDCLTLIPDSEVYDMLNSEVEELVGEETKSLRKTNKEISNVLRFVRQVNENGEKMNVSLLETFLRNMNKNKAVMKFLAVMRNEEYVKLALEMSA